MAKSLEPKFHTQWNTAHTFTQQRLDETDTAIPDLTYSIGELRRRFTLETEVLLSQQRRQGQYVFNSSNLDDENVAFDSPEVTCPRDFDLVDADAVKDSLRRAVMALQNSRNDQRKADDVTGHDSVQGDNDTPTGDNGKAGPSSEG